MLAALTVYPSKRKLARLTVGSFAFVVGGIFIIRDASVPLILKVLGGYAGAGWLRWSEIKDVRIRRFMSQRFLAIIPVDLNAVLGRMSVWKRVLMRINVFRGK